jgi:hypothetical protein
MKFAAVMGIGFVAMSAMGCAVATEASGSSSAAATVGVHSYTCTAPGNDGDDVQFTVDTRNDTATLDGGEGHLDRAYHPRPGQGLEGYHMYDGFPADEGDVSVIVHPSLASGRPAAKDEVPAGHIRVQSRGEGFEAVRYFCTKN